jgi:(5-formylfuran-3-yl)methyl phosphate synthase
MSGTSAARSRFLVSVRSVDEARIALAGGADIVDAKEPDAGSLGAVETGTIAGIVAEIASQCAVSATVGDVDCNDAAERVREIAGTGVDFVKIGLFGSFSPSGLASLQRCATDGIRMIAVMFADRAPDWRQIAPLAETGFAGVMLDTAGKGQGLRTHLHEAAISAFLAEAGKHRLLAGLAGSLSEADARALLSLRPDVLGFRGALCTQGARTGALDGHRVAAMRRLMRQEETAPAA